MTTLNIRHDMTKLFIMMKVLRNEMLALHGTMRLVNSCHINTAHHSVV